MSDEFIDEEIKDKVLSDEGPSVQDLHDALMLNFITNMRIYDVVMAQLSVKDPALANQILAAHGDGTFIGPEPRMNYRFVWDEANNAYEESSE
jgi:hypothetical protein